MEQTQSKYKYQKGTYNAGDLVVVDTSSHLTKNVIKIIKVDEDFGVVSYLRNDLKVDTIGFSSIRPSTLWEKIKYYIEF